MATAEAIAQNFVQYYNQMFSTQRGQLYTLYQANAMLSFEGQAFKGPQAIGEKLASLPFTKVQRAIDTLDVQPSGTVPGALLILITGRLVVDDESQAQRFSQVFHLMPEGQSLYIANDAFRLNYG